MKETVNYFATSTERRIILAGWLKYREALRGMGIVEGFQWLDGSFVEDKERIKGTPPNDLDVVTFFRRPAAYKSDTDFEPFVGQNIWLFHRDHLKTSYYLDAFFVDLDGNSESIVSQTRYWLQLFSHQRDTGLWKGMLQVRHDDNQDDASLLARLVSATSEGGP